MVKKRYIMDNFFGISFGDFFDNFDDWVKNYLDFCEKTKKEEKKADDCCGDNNCKSYRSYKNKVWDNGKLTHSEEKVWKDGDIVVDEKFDAKRKLDNKEKECKPKKHERCCHHKTPYLKEGEVRLDSTRYEQLVADEKQLKGLLRDFVKLNEEVEKLRIENNELEKENKKLRNHIDNVVAYLGINGFDNKKGFINV